MTFFTDYTNLALIAILLLSGGLLAWPALRRGGGGLSAAEATQLINRRNAIVIDLRPAAEFGAGHLPSARSVEFGELQAKLGQVAKNKSTPVLLVCQNGQQSQKAAKAVAEAGYGEVHVLQGGVAAWQQAGMPVVK
ncbi:rhodanese-like domain-containing protein [Burkholderia alba]|uniref:rhodanese-like domain-containing protein n=1 Tax=Burkholderia alba TaxID=2683677 RepID=UPI002B0585DE|nr:rhodanese-like domain-containing protein [Burkholderia alba]